MTNRGLRLKERQKFLGLKDAEVSQAMEDGSIDTIRKLGKVGMSDSLLDSIEQGIEQARLKRIKQLQSAG